MPAHIGHLRLYHLSAANCVRLSQAALELRQFALKGFAFTELSSAATLTAEELGAPARGLPLADLRATHAQARLFLAHWVVGGKHPWGKSPPDSAMVRSAILTEADRILTAPDRDRAAIRFARWIERVPRRNEGTLAWLADRTHLTPTLMGIVNRAQNRRRRLSHRLDHEPPLIDDARYIPQPIPEKLYRELFSDAFQLRVDVGRTFISLVLARSLPEVLTWIEAARTLGLPSDLGKRLPALASAGLLTDLDDLIKRTRASTARLAQIDYRRTEAQVRDLQASEQWFLGWRRQHRPGTHPGTRRLAITWLWEHNAHGHILTGPVDMTAPKARTVYRQFSARLNVQQRLALSEAL